jgi:hypothetical protein
VRLSSEELVDERSDVAVHLSWFGSLGRAEYRGARVEAIVGPNVANSVPLLGMQARSLSLDLVGLGRKQFCARLLTLPMQDGRRPSAAPTSIQV